MDGHLALPWFATACSITDLQLPSNMHDIMQTPCQQRAKINSGQIQAKFSANQEQTQGKAGVGDAIQKQGGEVVFGKAKKSRQSGEARFGLPEHDKSSPASADKSTFLFMFILNQRQKQAIVQAKRPSTLKNTS